MEKGVGTGRREVREVCCTTRYNLQAAMVSIAKEETQGEIVLAGKEVIVR